MQLEQYEKMRCAYEDEKYKADVERRDAQEVRDQLSKNQSLYDEQLKQLQAQVLYY